jgi:predicted nuclease with TOPRIM domain
MEKKVLSPEELQSLKEIEKKQNNLIFELGQLEYQKIVLKNNIQSLEVESAKLGKLLTEKYGEGRIDPQTGEITPL